MAAVQEEEYTGPAMTAHDWMYVRIGVGLGVLTAIEVGLYYAVRDHGLSNAANIWMLLVLAFSKFIIVAAYFMHLKFDTPTFRRLFATGAGLAGFCYVAVLSAFGVFHGFVPWLTYGSALIILLIIVNRRSGGSDAHDEHDHAGQNAAHAH